MKYAEGSFGETIADAIVLYECTEENYPRIHVYRRCDGEGTPLEPINETEAFTSDLVSKLNQEYKT